jgi:VWFA-related protein
MRIQSWILNLAAAAIATSATVMAQAQDPQKQLPQKPAESAQDNQPESNKREFVLTIPIPTFPIRINVSVVDGANRPIPDLTREEFAIFEGYVTQYVGYFARPDSPVNFRLALHISDNESLKLMAQQTVRSFVSKIRSTDDLVIPQLNAGRETVRDYTADERKLEHALSGISSSKKLITLVSEATKSTKEKSKEPRSAVIVITDGHGLSSTVGARDADYSILLQGAPINFIILDDGRHLARHAARSRAPRTMGSLKRLAAASGGLALVVKNEDEISAATEQIIERLKNQYTVGFDAIDHKIMEANIIGKYDGPFRHIRVAVTPKDKRKVKVCAPSGYYAVDPR